MPVRALDVRRLEGIATAGVGVCAGFAEPEAITRVLRPFRLIHLLGCAVGRVTLERKEPSIGNGVDLVSRRMHARIVKGIRRGRAQRFHIGRDVDRVDIADRMRTVGARERIHVPVARQHDRRVVRRGVEHHRFRSRDRSEINHGDPGVVRNRGQHAGRVKRQRRRHPDQ